jgi:hypothetical protein
MKVVADDPKCLNKNTQTDCHIGCNMAHVITQIDHNSLSNFGNTSISRL